jgi:hypothetical protein
MPVLFIQNDGTIGLPLERALRGDRASLRLADMAAPLGGGHSTQIRIAVSTSSSPSPRLPPFFLRLSFSAKKNMVASQWPGYESWERQIQIRDQTRQRNEITLERFAKLVAGVVDRFLVVWAFFFGLFGTYDELIDVSILPYNCSLHPQPPPRIPPGGLDWGGSLATTL